MKKQLILYKQIDINSQMELIRHNNAFILPRGDFYLAKGYKDSNPSHQLESSALSILRKETSYNYKKSDFEQYFRDIGINYKKRISEQGKILYYLRSVLVHYYGYTLFARKEFINNYDDRNKFFDCSLISNPEYYGKEATPQQLETLKKLFEINDDDTFMDDSELNFQKVLSHDIIHSRWNNVI